MASAGAAREPFPSEGLTAEGVAVEFDPADRDAAEAVPVVVASAREEILKRLGLEVPPLVRVRLLRKGEAFLGPTGGRPVELYAGMAYPNAGIIHVSMNAVAEAGSMRGMALARTVRHELVHLAVGRTLGGAELPKWFEEGVACAFGSPLSARDMAVLGDGRILPLASLTKEFPRARALVPVAYAESESVLRFLVRDRSEAAVREVFGRLAAGEPFERALEGAAGYGAAGLEAAWRRSLSYSRGLRLARTLFAPGALFLWQALVVVAGYFFVRRRRRRAMEDMDRFPW